jgi:LDH2 family malate/lactate/ureidoglycolate dehydrogenase
MATSSVAFGKVEIAQRKEQSIPKTWGADKDGQVKYPLFGYLITFKKILTN